MKFKYIYYTGVIGLLFILLYKIAIQIPNAIDLMGSDEAVYLRYGVIERHVSQEWAPAYNFWYYFLSKFTANNIQLYYLNQQLLLVFTSLFLFLFSYLKSKNVNFSFVSAALFAILPWTIGIFPKISLFCFMCLLALGCLLHFIKGKNYKGAVFVAGMYLCIYLRSEFIIAFILSLIGFSYCLISDYRKSKSVAYKSVLLLVFLLMGITATFGVLSFKSMNGMDKMYIAFLQHWGIYYTISHSNEFKSTTLHDLYNTTFLQMFGPERTFIGIIKHQPFIVIKHIFVNLFFSTKMVLKYFVDYLFPNYYLSFLKHIRHILLFAGLSAYLYWYIIKKRVNLKDYIQSNLSFLLVMGVLFLSISVTNFIIGFQEHYYYLLFCWCLTMLLYFINVMHRPLYNSNLLTVAFGLLLLLFTPKLTEMNFSHANAADAKKLPNKIVYSYLNQHTNTKDTVAMVAVEGGSEVYINKINIKVLPIISLGFFDGKSIIESVAKENVDYILVDNTLKIIANGGADKGMLQIIESPAKYGFTKQINFRSLKNTYLLAR